MIQLRDLNARHQLSVHPSNHLDLDHFVFEMEVVAHRGYAYQPDWPRVVALVNQASSQDRYNAIVVYDDNSQIWVTSTTNQLVKRAGRYYGYQFDTDVYQLAKSVAIRRHIPYVCGDYWLMPVTQCEASNYSWYRWRAETDQWIHHQAYTEVVVHAELILRISLSQEAMERRARKCRLMAGALKQLGREAMPQINQQHLRLPTQSVNKLKVTFDQQKTAIIHKKVS